MPRSLPTIVRACKSAVTKRIHTLPEITGQPVWQHNSYERIIRNQSALNADRRYIINNPHRWYRDRHHCWRQPNLRPTIC